MTKVHKRTGQTSAAENVSATKRTNLSIPLALFNDARKIMAQERFATFSDYVAQLIRDDKKRRGISPAEEN